MAADVESQYNKNNPFLARLTENKLLYKEGSNKDTRHFVVDLDGSALTYECGDSLGVFPNNREEDVDALLKALAASGEELVVLPRTETPISLREALFSKLSLASPTRKTLLRLADKVENGAEKARLAELLDDDNKQSTAEYLANREFIDLLGEFPSARFTPQEFVEGLRKLMPRLYSIASSPVLYPKEAHLTVSVVLYETNNKPRFGVCSTFLTERTPLGEPCLPVFVAKSHFRLPEDDSAPMIMVGPGTGIAPFRAFLQERIATGASGKNWLFFGDQHQTANYLYGDEFDAMKEAGHLERLDLAWSRDQDHKIYVQDKMLESGAAIWEWINRGAYFYVCGDAQYMAKDVDAALHTIAQKHGGLSEDDSVLFFKQMKRDKRYQRDIY